MNLRFALPASIVALAAATHASDAGACGGCFISQTETTVVNAHRMAFAVSTAQTVLWDQIQYSGDPLEFAWVLPVKAGAVVELSTDAWFETLDAATSAQVASPPLNCAPSSSGGGCGIGCGASAASINDLSRGIDLSPPVTVTHEGTVGPYETVTLHANVPGALPGWLTMHGYAIDPAVQPVIDAYTAEGFDFIALRLLPSQGVQQMKPVRVVTPGMSPTLPLRMVAAGTGPNVALTLFVIGEGRMEVQNFPNGTVDVKKLSWDFALSDSNYGELRKDVMARNGSQTWNNAYAKQGALLSTLVNPTTQLPVQYTVSFQSFSTFGEAYVQQGIANGETTVTTCVGAFRAFAASADPVADPCPGQGGGGGGAGGGTGGGPGCVTLPPGEIDSRQFACGALDDVAVALTGLHPQDVWLSRLEANLPHAALASDLTLQAAASQTPVENWLTATIAENPPCVAAAPPPSGISPADRRFRQEMALYAVLLGALGITFGRRLRRPVLSPVR
jgi:hypothetical protein